MRRVSIGAPPRRADGPMEEYFLNAVHELANASFDNDAGQVADAFTVSNVTPTYSLDASAATLADLRNFVGTFVLALQKRGSKKG